MKSLFVTLVSFFRSLFGKKRPQPDPQQAPEILEEGWMWPVDDVRRPISPTPVLPQKDIPTPQIALLYRCLAHMESKGMVIDRQIGGGNIIFVSGYGLDWMPNDNKDNKWNDLCFVARNTPAGWAIPFAAECTTAPGTAPSLAKTALQRGGIARIVPGQYFAWQRGFHKQAKYGTKHPAFKQVKVVTYTRDFNQDMSTAGDKSYSGVIGVNIHAQGEGRSSEDVNFNSEGCLVLRYFAKLQELRELVKDFNLFKESGEETIFAATIIEGSDLAA